MALTYFCFVALQRFLASIGKRKAICFIATAKLIE